MDRSAGPALSAHLDTSSPSLPSRAKVTLRRGAGSAWGFTLVEAAVLIVAIVVVVGMLMPALTAGRARSRLAACRSNLSQLVSAASLYAQGQNGLLPVEAAPHNPHKRLMEQLGPYLPNKRAFYCPSASGDLAYSAENASQGNISYFYYSYRNYQRDRRFPKWLIRGANVLTRDSSPKAWVFSDYLYRDKPSSHASYGKGINFVRLDGSFGFITKQPRTHYEEAFGLNGKEHSCTRDGRRRRRMTRDP